MSTNRRSCLLSLLVIGLGLLTLKWALEPSAPPQLTVHRSEGGAVQRGTGVLLPGDRINWVHPVRVLLRPLWLRLGDSSLQIRLRIESRLRVVRTYRDPRSVRLLHLRGSGRAFTESTPVLHHWGRITLLQERGRLRWTATGEGVRLEAGGDFEGGIRRNGELHRLGSTGGLGGIRWRRGTGTGPFDWPPALPEYYRHVSSLVRPTRVLERTRQRLQRGQPVHSTRDVFGHWVRDRWGGVYLLETSPGAIRLISAGPDGRFHTSDDRRWDRPRGADQGSSRSED